MVNSEVRIARQRAYNTSRWSGEYATCSKCSGSSTAQSPRYRAPVHGGDIRLLCDIREHNGMPRAEYVLVHRKWHDEATLIIPFSPFAHPANELELRLGETTKPEHRVLQVWNTRTIGNEFMNNSFLCGRVSLATRDEIVIMLHHYWLGESLDALGGARCRLGQAGSDISDVLADKIRAYMSDEIEMFAEIDAADIAKLDRYDED